MLYPFALGLYYSLTSYYLQYPHLFRFVWFANYAALATEPRFFYSLNITLGYTAVAVVVQIGLGLATALFLNARIPGRAVLRAMMLMPLMMPPVITALMWKIMMASTNAGILNYLLSFAGLAPDAIRSGVSELAGLVRRQGARPRRSPIHRVARRVR
jgi:multiple sugar transport system permease protein